MNESKIVLTGDRPTGALHLGHFVGSLKNRLDLQTKCQQYIMIADSQALTDNFEHPERVKKNILEVALDYLSVGIDPNLSTIFIQSLIPQLFELTSYYLNLVSWNRLKHNPTVKNEIMQKGFKDATPAGFMIYPISQAADITAFKADLVPVGEDQLPMIEQTVEIVRKFNRIYNSNVLIEPKAVTSSITRLPGIDGKAKMSKSLNNAIFLSDGEDKIVEKVKKMYTDPNHLRVEDPGTVEGNPVFTYLDAFDNNKSELNSLKEHYKKGGLGDSKVKKHLIDVIQGFLTPIRQKRKEISQDTEYVMNIIFKGTEKARLQAEKTLQEVKDAMGINYLAKFVNLP
jgi:tryptophanyl-tRNA synthetase